MTKDEVIDLMKDAGYGVLATVEGDTPKARPMMPHVDDNGDLLLAVLPHSRTITQIKANPRVEMCYIDRKMNFARVAGNAAVTDDAAKKELVWNNVPMLRQYFTGPQDPNLILIEITTDTVEAMTPQQKTPDVINFK